MELRLPHQGMWVEELLPNPFRRKESSPMRSRFPNRLHRLLAALQRRRKIVVTFLCLTAAATVSSAQSYKTGAVGAVLKVTPSNTCSPLTTWYNPSLFTLPNGEKAFIAQAARPVGSQSCAYTKYIDSFYSASTSGGTWTTPSASSCPVLGGAYNRCGYLAPPDSGPIGNPSVVKVGSTYYMAFNGGNADFTTGRIYWATSSDGINWSVYDVNPPAGENWTPIVRPKYHDCEKNGPGETYLNFVASDTSAGPQGTFYLYLSHYDLRSNPEPKPSKKIFDNWAIRFAYDSSAPGGLGGNRQIWHQGQWKTFASGTMVWSYDAPQPGVAGEPVLGAYEGENFAGRFGFGAGDLKLDPISGQWLHVWSVQDSPGVFKTFSQTTASLASNLWSEKQEIDMGTVRSLVPPPPGGTPTLASTLHYEPGLHYGTSGNRTGWWIYTPVNYLGCESEYLGLGIVPAELCTQSAPTVSTLSVTSGTPAGGTAVTLTGTHLDCASQVTFGGTGASIVSRNASQIVVTTPAHAAGTVGVAVTTAGGSVTQPSAFTYTAPPVYEGFHDTVDCFGVAGWAWDSNQPNTPISVDVYDGSTLLGTVSANLFRQGLLDAGKGNGVHGFGYSLPSSIRNGASHSIGVKYAGTSTLLGNSPRTITCRSLTVTKAGTGAGTVTSSPSGVACGSSCQSYFASGTAVSLTATPGSGASFGGWSGDADCVDGSVTLSANRSCTATFNATAAAARVLWLQPSALAGFGSTGALVMAGSATGAAAGTLVSVSWRDGTQVDPPDTWHDIAYTPAPDSNGIWFHEIPGVNYSHHYEVRAVYGTLTTGICTYSGSGGFYSCP
jgi:IPT/TIG domain/Divergent InlB B-repeat domain